MGGKSSTTTQSVTIPQEVMDRYNAINKRAEGVAQTPFQTYSDDPSKFVAQLNEQQQTGIQNVNAASGSYQPYIAGATGATMAGMSSAAPGQLNTEQYMNPFQQQVIDATMRQMGQANEQAQSGALGTAIQSGAFGGDRAGIAAANLANQQGLAMGSTLAGLNAQNYGQALGAAQQQQGVQLGASQADLARLLAGGQQLAGLGQASQAMGLQGAEAQINAGTLGQQTEQAGLSALYNQFLQKNAYPFQVSQFLANIGMGTGALSGSNTTTTQPSSFFSDRRLKEDVQRIGEGDNGLPIYKYRYKGEPDTHIGFMADEVERVNPDAVGLHPTGYKTVDYDRATKAEGGGVAGPYGSPVGSQPGLAGYVPEAYLPVGQLMVADSSALQNAEQGLAEQLAAAANFGSNLSDLRQNFGKDGDFWLSNEQRRALEASGERTDPAMRRSTGGVADGYADGGAAYLNAGLKPDQNPVDKRTYLSDIVSGQEGAKRNEGLQGPGSVPKARSTGEDIADFAKIAMAFMGMNRGGRTGYADGGYEELTPEESRRLAEAGARQTARPSVQLNGGPETPAWPEGGVVPAIPVPQVRPSARLEEGPAAPAWPEGGVVSEMPTPPVRPQQRPAGLSAGPSMEELSGAGIGGLRNIEVADTNITGLKPEMAAGTRAAPSGVSPATSAFSGVSGAGKGYTDVILPDGTVERRTGVRSWRNNNPGNIEYGSFAKDHGAVGSDGRFAVFPTYEAGRAAKGALLFNSSGYSGKTISTAIQRYAPPGENDTNAYISAVSSAIGVDPNTPLSDLTQEQREAMLTAMERVEGGGAGGRTDLGPYTTSRTGLAGGVGASGVVGGGLADGMGGPLGGDKAWSDRTSVGKMFYNPDGRMNKDALLSILSGIGTMASSPSRYLGAAILQGVGGAANTYAGLEKQRAEIGATNLANMSKIMSDTSAYNQLYGTNYTPEQYAQVNGIQMPQLATADTIKSGAYTPTTGGNLDRMSYGELQSGTVDIGGQTVRRENDPDSLRRYINDNSMFRGMEGALGNSVATAEARLAEIEARGGVTFDVNGNEVVIPSYVSAGNTLAQNEANRAATTQFRTTGAERIPQIDQQLAEIGKQAVIFSGLEGGAFATEKANVQAALGSLGFDVPESVASTQQAIKIAAAQMLGELGSGNLPGGAPASELARLEQIVADPNLQPEAIKTILVMKQAQLERERDRYNSRRQWEAENGAMNDMDQLAYEQWFADNRPFTGYLEDAKSGMPRFAGEAGSEQKPHQIFSDAQFYETVRLGDYFITPDGVTRQRMQ